MATTAATQSASSGASDRMTSGAPAGRTATKNSSANDITRIATGVLGAALVAFGLKRRSVAGSALAVIGGDLLYHGVTGESMLMRVTQLDGLMSAARNEIGTSIEATEVERSITIGCSARELYDRWRDPQQLAHIFGHFADVTPIDDETSHWRVHAPMNRTMEFDSKVIQDRPGELIRCASLPGARVPNEWSVRFRPAPDGWGTEVGLRARFDPPGGAVGEWVANHMMMAPRMAAERALRRFKSLAETGEMPTLSQNVSARGVGDSW
jgi:uncharacterized membrane protein